MQFEKENPQATTSHQIYEGGNIPLTIVIATPLMKRVHEKHSGMFIRHAGEFLHMDHYELTYVFILLINLLVIELFYGRSCFTRETFICVSIFDGINGFASFIH